MAAREILLATNNPNKAREMRDILDVSVRTSEDATERGPEADAECVIRWRSLEEFASEAWPKPVEDGSTFADNARIKARHYGSLSRLWTLADDSGLEVDALNGEPGVQSARYAGKPGDDRANNALLVRRLAGVPTELRSAQFRCVVVLSDGRNDLALAEGTVEGRIVDEPRGSNGFGYDPHFWVESLGMTAAQMEPQQKHAISHRGQALRNLREQLQRLIGA